MNPMLELSECKVASKGDIVEVEILKLTSIYMEKFILQIKPSFFLFWCLPNTLRRGRK
jgi:hypothetical protein